MGKGCGGSIRSPLVFHIFARYLSGVSADAERHIFTISVAVVCPLDGSFSKNIVAIRGLLSGEDSVATSVVSSSDFYNNDSIDIRMASSSIGVVAAREHFETACVYYYKVANMVARPVCAEYWDGTTMDGRLWIVLRVVGVRRLGN